MTVGSTHRFKVGKRATASHYTQLKPNVAKRRHDARKRLEELQQAQADRKAAAEERRERNLRRLLHDLLGIQPQQR